MYRKVKNLSLNRHFVYEDNRFLLPKKNDEQNKFSMFLKSMDMEKRMILKLANDKKEKAEIKKAIVQT